MYFGQEKETRIKQLIAPAVPLWAEFEESDGVYDLPGCKMKGWAEPVVALALIEIIDNGELYDEVIEPLIANRDNSVEPIGPASVMMNFRGVSTLPPTRIVK